VLGGKLAIDVDLRRVGHRAKPQPDTLLEEVRWNDKLSLVPHPPDVVADLRAFGEIVERRGNSHRHRPLKGMRIPGLVKPGAVI